MNLSSRISIEDRAQFEAVTGRVVGLGTGFAVLWAPFRQDPASTWLPVLATLAVGTLLAASSLRGRDDTLPLVTRVLFGVVAAAIGLCLDSLGAAVVAVGALTGLAMAGPPGTASTRQLAGAAGGALGAGWALAIIPAVLPQLHGLPRTAAGLVSAVAAAVLFALGLLAPHLRLHADALSAKLEALQSEAGKRLHRTWVRCHQALRRAPASDRSQLLRLLDGMVREAERMLASAQTLGERLTTANPTDAQAQLAELKADVAAATDPLTRDRLQSAASSLSDSLEHLQTLERKRERFAAELKLKLATLERAALALEAAQGEPSELRTLALRLTAP